MNLEDEILALVGGNENNHLLANEQHSPLKDLPQTKQHQAARKKRTKNDSSDSEFENPSANASAKRRRRRRTDASEEPVTPKISSMKRRSSRNDSIDGFDEEFVGDSKDRKWLMALPEVEREKIIAERAEKRQQLIERKEIQDRLEKDKVDDTQRRSTRAPPTVQNLEGLRELKRRRDDKGARKALQPQGSPDARKKRRDSDSSESEHRERGERRAYSRRQDDEDERCRRKASQPVPYEDISLMTMTKDRLASWVNAPYFEKAVIGAFVRINMGPRYCMAYVKDVTEHTKPYKFGTTITNKALSLQRGDQEKVFTMEWLSGSPITKEEYGRYLELTKDQGGVMPDERHLARKREDIEYATNYILNDKEINDMVKRRQKLNAGSVHVGKELMELLRRKDNAQASNDKAELAEILQQLYKLEKRERATEKAREPTAWVVENEKSVAASHAATQAAIKEAEIAIDVEKKRLKAEDYAKRLAMSALLKKSPNAARSPSKLKAQTTTTMETSSASASPIAASRISTTAELTVESKTIKAIGSSSSTIVAETVTVEKTSSSPSSSSIASKTADEN